VINGRQAAKITYEFFHRKTTAGIDFATNSFYGSTMQNTDTSIVDWIAVVRRRATILKNTGSNVDDKAMVVRLLGGLLPEFKEIRVILQRTPNLDFESAVDELIDFAQTENLVETTRTGRKKANSSTYLLNSKFDTVCRGWAMFSCKYGSD
jgi:hypothetical protein